MGTPATRTRAWILRAGSRTRPRKKRSKKLEGLSDETKEKSHDGCDGWWRRARTEGRRLSRQVAGCDGRAAAVALCRLGACTVYGAFPRIFRFGEPPTASHDRSRDSLSGASRDSPRTRGPDYSSSVRDG